MHVSNLPRDGSMQETGDTGRLSVTRSSPVDLVLSLVPEWDELLGSTLELSASLLEARWCALFLVDPDCQRLMLARLWDAERGIVPLDWDVSLEELDGELGPGAVPCPRGKWLEWLPGGEGVEEGSSACVPVDVEGTCFGVVEAVRSVGEQRFSPGDLASLRMVARHLGLWLRNSAILRQLRELAITDGLTGIYNHRYFQDRLELEMERATRYNRPLSLAMLDLNDFKRYNDVYGHQQGDLVLRLTALAIQRAVRRADAVARYGGDEFAIIFPETSSAQAMVVANRILKAILAMDIPTLEGGKEPVSCSIGVSSYSETAESRNELVAQADEALYRAKRGRAARAKLWEPRRVRSGAKLQGDALPA